MEQKIIHHLMMCSFSLSNLGLFHGKTGVALFFYHYSKFTNNTVYSEYARDLVDDIWNNLHDRLPENFKSGLAGIAWGVEYMILNGFVTGNSNEICSEIDARIMQSDLRRITPKFIEQELEGFLHYVLIRTAGSVRQNNCLPFDEMYHKDLFKVFSSLLSHEKTNETCRYFINQYLSTIRAGKELGIVNKLKYQFG